MQERRQVRLHPPPAGRHLPRSSAAAGPPPLRQATTATTGHCRTPASALGRGLWRTLTGRTQAGTAQRSGSVGRMAERATAARWTWGRAGSPRLIRRRQPPGRPHHRRALSWTPAGEL